MVQTIAHAKTNQKGTTLVEAALGLAVMAVAMAALTQLMAENASLARGKAAADRLNEVTEASEAYIRANWNALIAVATPGAPIVIPAGKETATATPPSGPSGLPSLQGGNFLPQNFIDTNSWGQRHALLIREPVPNQLEALVVTYGGSDIPDRILAKIPAMIGGKGGAMLSAPLTGTVGQVTGVQGGWQTAATTWASSWAGGSTTPTTGRVMTTLGFDITGATQPYLYRDNLGDPSLNRMNTAIDMSGNDIDNAADVGAVSVTTTGDASIGGNLTVSNGYAYVGSATVVGDMNVGGRIYARDVVLTGIGGASGQSVSQAMFGGAIHASGDLVAKPNCGTLTPQVFVLPAMFSDDGTGAVLSSAQAWAQSVNASYWQVFLRVRANNSTWTYPSSSYGSVVAFTKCT